MESLAYTTYGEITERLDFLQMTSRERLSQPYGFAGEARTASGLYYRRARWMDPHAGRFLSMDVYPGSLRRPISQHPYLYANANPACSTDPSGYVGTSEVSIAPFRV